MPLGQQDRILVHLLSLIDLIGRMGPWTDFLLHRLDTFTALGQKEGTYLKVPTGTSVAEKQLLVQLRP